MAHLHAIDGFWPLIQVLDISIPTYYLIVSLSLSVCLLWVVHRAKVRELDGLVAIDLSILIMLSGFFGARIFHILFEDFDFYLKNPIEIFKFWNGGFVFYGGALAAFFSGIMFLRWRKQVLGDWLNLVAPVAALGYALGRMACLVTGCCFGRICDLNPEYQFRHPTQLYAVIFEFVVLCILLRIEKKPSILNKRITQTSGHLFVIWLVFHSLGRIMMEYFRADPRGAMYFSLSISTWISIFILAFSGLYLKRGAQVPK